MRRLILQDYVKRTVEVIQRKTEPFSESILETAVYIETHITFDQMSVPRWDSISRNYNFHIFIDVHLFLDLFDQIIRSIRATQKLYFRICLKFNRMMLNRLKRKLENIIKSYGVLDFNKLVKTNYILLTVTDTLLPSNKSCYRGKYSTTEVYRVPRKIVHLFI